MDFSDIYVVEAGAITVAYALLVECLVYKGVSLRRDYGEVASECVTVVGGVLLIIGVAVGFTNYLVDAQLPALLIAWTHAHIHSKYAFLLLLNLLLLLKGSFMDVFSAPAARCGLMHATRHASRART
jgi:C4-dicarboxylate transporter DctM subunit